MTFYKILNLDGSAHNGGKGKWYLPTKKRDGTWEPGKWMPKLTELVPCEHGYHLCQEQDLTRWLGPMICVAEGRGEQIVCDDKIVFAQARLLSVCENWNERTERLFAADCAERVLPIWEKKYPGDLRPRQAIEAARLFADEKITPKKLAAARAAARDAARAAAGDAAGDAAWAAAWAAARAAAWDAAWDAARAAARAAAGDAAWDAARAAARAAAWDAAGAAAWAAAGAAAWDAECEWQTKRLLESLGEKWPYYRRFAARRK